jgi:hypothetical protein
MDTSDFYDLTYFNYLSCFNSLGPILDLSRHQRHQTRRLEQSPNSGSFFRQFHEGKAREEVSREHSSEHHQILNGSQTSLGLVARSDLRLARHPGKT